MEFELSKYQQDILDYVKQNKGNLLIDAKAGSGKTSTLILVAEQLANANQNCMFLSFNKSIVEELKLKIPYMSNSIKTVHSLGLSFIRSYCYKKHNTNYEIIDMDTSKKKVRELCKQFYELKYQKLITDYLKKTMSEKEIKDEHTALVTDFVQLVNFSRLYCLSDFADEKQVKYLANRFCSVLPNYEDVIGDFSELVSAVLSKILDMFDNPPIGPDGKYQYSIDFTDMIFFPVWYQMQVPYSLKNSLDTILVDESQDLSLLQQMFVRRLYTGFNRFIFVGDRNQSIYGFNGADTAAIDRIKDNFRPKELPLSICYRCPEKIVRLARENVPSIEWNKDRVDKGTLRTITPQDMKTTLSAGEIIVGRSNRDLLKLYKDFTLVDKREVKFRNKEMVNAINRDITQCIRDYMQNYAKNKNIDRVVHTYMQEFCKANPSVKINSNVYNTEISEFIKRYAKENREEFDKKKIMKANQTLDYLEICMDEYYELGAYDYEPENILTVYFDIIEEFLKEYKQNHTSILVKDFMEYMSSFLNASLNKYNVPIIASIHSMKGGEADTVYILDYPRLPYRWNNMTKDDEQQEKNLQYVAVTRAKKNLYLVLCDPNKAKDDKQMERIIESNTNCCNKVAEINRLVDDLNASKYNL